MYVDASSECNDLAFQLGPTVIDAAAVTRSWSIKVVNRECGNFMKVPLNGKIEVK